MTPWLGLLLIQFVGAALLSLRSLRTLGAALRSPASFFVGLAALYLAALASAGAPAVLSLVLVAWLVREGGGPDTLLPSRAVFALAFVALLLLARAMVPTMWDEFVWLAKARFSEKGWDGVLLAALDPAQQLIPAGYPPLWPTAVGWISLGQDAVGTHTLSASLLVVLGLAAAAEAWHAVIPGSTRPLLVVLALAPLAWVHARSTYVDLPVGLLSLALVGHLLSRAGRPGAVGMALAIVMVGFKDEGLAHVLAACVAAWAGREVRSWRTASLEVAAVALVVAFAWRRLAQAHGVLNTDHALGAPYWPWLGTLAELAVQHATDLLSWGVVWPVVLAAALVSGRSPAARTLALALLFNLAFMAAALLMGPERVRVFAENGTLLNRLLMQLWPLGAMVVVSLARPDRSTPAPT